MLGVLIVGAGQAAAATCPFTAKQAPGEGGMTPRPVAFWAGTLVSDPALLERIPGKSKTLGVVRDAMLDDSDGLPALFDAVGGEWINYVGDFSGLQDTLGTNPMADKARRYLGVMVSIDRLVRFKPDVVEMSSGVEASRAVQYLFGSVSFFDVRGMHIAFSFPFVITDQSEPGETDLAPPGVLLREKIAAATSTLGNPDNRITQTLACQLRGAVLRYLGLSEDMEVSSDGGVDAAIFMQGIQGFRVNGSWFKAQGDVAVADETARRVKALISYMARVKVARTRPVAPLANARGDQVAKVGKKGIRAVYDDDVAEAGQMCGVFGERVSWNEQGDRVACFELPKFQRKLDIGARIGTRLETTQGDYKRLRVDSILDLMMKDGPRKSVGHVKSSYTQRVGKADATQITDAHVARALIKNVSKMDVTELKPQ